ncbi:MAG: MFS transporter [Patescibacteria group bacterium]|nr:MFS transporter [Patescibacteria group bacterium]
MYSLDRLLHHFHIFRPRRKPTGFEALVVNYTISQVATGMLGIFGVLFIYELGHDLMSGLILVLGFFGLQRLAVGLMIPLAAKGITKIGYRWMMLVGLVSLAIKAFLLMQVTVNNLWLLMVILILGAMAIAGYYLGYHGIFLDDNDDDKIGEQMGLITMAGRMALIISPILAGWLIDNYGFSIMFGVAMSLLIVSLGPLFLMPHHKHNDQEFDFKKAIKLTKRSRFSKSVFWWHFENAIQAFYWPIFLFLILGSHIKFGIIASLVMIINSVAVYSSGKIYDKRPLKRGYLMATGLVSISYVLRFLSLNLACVVGADSLNRLVSPFWWMKIRRKALIAGEKVGAMVFAAAWEWLVTAGYLGGLLIGFVILKLSDGQWLWLAVPAIVGVVMGAKHVEN